MGFDMTVDQFEQRLRSYGQLVGNLDANLQQWFSQKVDEIRALAPVAAEDGGALRSSIKLTGDRFSFQIEMNYYGVFQNYGVKGLRSSRQPVRTPEAGLTIGGVRVEQQPFQFGTGNFWKTGPAWGAYYTGIRARSFFSVTDIQNELVEFIQEQTTI